MPAVAGWLGTGTGSLCFEKVTLFLRVKRKQRGGLGTFTPSARAAKEGMALSRFKWHTVRHHMLRKGKRRPTGAESKNVRVKGFPKTLQSRHQSSLFTSSHVHTASAARSPVARVRNDKLPERSKCLISTSVPGHVHSQSPHFHLSQDWLIYGVPSGVIQWWLSLCQSCTSQYSVKELAAAEKWCFLTCLYMKISLAKL